jgi:hypothetical protein
MRHFLTEIEIGYEYAKKPVFFIFLGKIVRYLPISQLVFEAEYEG